MSPRCLSSLSELPQEGYCAAAQRALAGANRKFPARLTFNREDVVRFRMDTVEHMSISGVQDKISLRLIRGKLEPSDHDGEYILKPIPSADIPRFKSDVPANEHVTMQIASKLFGIETAPNACIRFADGELAYIIRRFDRRNGKKLLQEDFCQLSNWTEETSGRNYKYDSSYEEVGRVLRRTCPAYSVEVEKLFARIVFNYVFSNGDSHLKNFSLYESPFGDPVLTPAYDLLCTSLHFPNESATALDLFDAFESDTYRANGFYTRVDFLRLAEFYGIRREQAERILSLYPAQSTRAEDWVRRSFLSDAAQADYLARYQDRLKAIRLTKQG